jgi:hypothetical protein
MTIETRGEGNYRKRHRPGEVIKTDKWKDGRTVFVEKVKIVDPNTVEVNRYKKAEGLKGLLGFKELAAHDRLTGTEINEQALHPHGSPRTDQIVWRKDTAGTGGPHPQAAIGDHYGAYPSQANREQPKGK